MENIVSSASYIFCKNKLNQLCILAGKRGSTAPSCPNMYNVPTGMREFNETPQQCAQRETYEETNLNISADKFKYIDSEEWAKGKFGANFVVQLDGFIDEYRIGNGDGENSKFQWISIDEINSVQWAYNMDTTVLKMSQNIMLETVKQKFHIILEKLTKKD